MNVKTKVKAGKLAGNHNTTIRQPQPPATGSKPLCGPLSPRFTQLPPKIQTLRAQREIPAQIISTQFEV